MNRTCITALVLVASGLGVIALAVDAALPGVTVAELTVTHACAYRAADDLSDSEIDRHLKTAYDNLRGHLTAQTKDGRYVPDNDDPELFSRRTEHGREYARIAAWRSGRHFGTVVVISTDPTVLGEDVGTKVKSLKTRYRPKL